MTSSASDVPPSGELHGTRMLVTGGSSGIGLAVSVALAELGARVALVGRSPATLADAIAQLPGDGHESFAFDVSDGAAWMSELPRLDRGGELHGLVTAAGVLGPVGSLDAIAIDEFAATIAINLVGTALAIHHAVPRLKKTDGRIVTFSGGGGTGPLPRYDAYAASKAGVVRLTENVAIGGGVEINCVAPGFVATKMHEGTLAAGPDAAGTAYYERTREQLRTGGFPASEAAALVAYLLSAAARGINGRLISAQWDPWRSEQFRARLRDDPDLARLRRIDEQFYARLA